MFDFPTGIVEQAAHRPWLMPDAPWLMTQSWHDLLFAHWPVDRELLLSKVPPGLPLDLYDEQVWGVVAQNSLAVSGARLLLASPTTRPTRREWMCMMRLVGFSTPADVLEMPIRRS